MLQTLFKILEKSGLISEAKQLRSIAMSYKQDDTIIPKLWHKAVSPKIMEQVMIINADDDGLKLIIKNALIIYLASIGKNEKTLKEIGFET